MTAAELAHMMLAGPFPTIAPALGHHSVEQDEAPSQLAVPPAQSLAWSAIAQSGCGPWS